MADPKLSPSALASDLIGIFQQQFGELLKGPDPELQEFLARIASVTASAVIEQDFEGLNELRAGIGVLIRAYNLKATREAQVAISKTIYLVARGALSVLALL